MTHTEFRTESIDLRKPSENNVEFSKLLSLITEPTHIEFLNNRFNPDGEEFSINIGKVDIAFKAVKKWTTKYTYQNCALSGNEIDNYFLITEDEDLDAALEDMIFIIPQIEMDNGDVYQNVKCRSIYSSKDQFYEELKLSTHVNFLKKGRYNDQLKKVNAMWDGHEAFSKPKKYKILQNKDKRWFLRSINSTGFQEYGTAFTFVFTVLLLDEITRSNPESKFIIELLDLSESKISMTVSQGHGAELEDLGHIKSSIVLTNNDLGKGSFKLTKNITLIPNIPEGHTLSLTPPNKDNVNQIAVSVDHSTLLKTLNSKFSGLSTDFWSVEEFVDDYYTILKSKNAEGVRSAIEQKIENSTILNKFVEIKDLFKPNAAGVVDNMAKLINLCGRAEALDIDYDLKSKLREIISEVLFIRKKY